MTHSDDRTRGVAAALDAVHKRYGNHAAARIALDGFSMEVRFGEVVGLAGLNGAGKTTALKVLLGLATADRGAVRLDPGLRGFGRTALVPEESVHPPQLTAREVVATFASLTPGRTVALTEAATAGALARAGIADLANVRTAAFSKGMGRRLGLACALVTEPALLVLDEPQSGLDPRGRRDLGQLLAAERARGAAILLASHDLHEIERWADRVVLVHAGRVVADITRGTGQGTLQDEFFRIIGNAPGTGIS